MSPEHAAAPEAPGGDAQGSPWDTGEWAELDLHRGDEDRGGARKRRVGDIRRRVRPAALPVPERHRQLALERAGLVRCQSPERGALARNLHRTERRVAGPEQVDGLATSVTGLRMVHRELRGR